LENVKSLSVTLLNRGLDTRCCMGLGTEEIRERERERERGFCVVKVKSEDSYRWKASLDWEVEPLFLTNISFMGKWVSSCRSTKFLVITEAH